MTRFKLHQDVALVEHRDGEPIESGRVMWGTVTQAGPCSVHATYGADDIPRMFLLDSHGQAWNAAGKWRLVPVCERCEDPILGEPVIHPAGPGPGHVYCGSDCEDTAAEAWHELHYREA